MKKFLLIAVISLQGFLLHAQTFTANFTGAAAAIPNGATTQKCFPVTVTGIGVINATTIGLSQVCLNITHPDDGDIEIILKAPDGTIVPLSVQNGDAGNNYTGTCFTATAANSIKSGTAPFTGIFSPEGHLGAVNNGQNANGTWTICVQDRRNTGSTGSLTNFALTFSNTPAPAPPALPACSTTLPATSTCANATSICDFSGLCGTTNGNAVQDWGSSGLDGCFGIENNSFLKFIAAGTSASFSVWVPTSSMGGNYYTGGIQMIFFSGTCGSGAVTSHGCYPHIYPFSAPGVPIISVVTATGLVPGNTYYLMIDGFGGDHCKFTIEANNGVNILSISPQAPAICAGANVNLTASGGNGTYSWSPAATLSSPTGATVTATPTGTTMYTVTSTTGAGCPITKDVTVTINPLPAVTAQPSAATQSICPGQTATALTITATAGSGTITGYQWYSNAVASNTGGTLIPGATSATYTPPTSPAGTLYYYCVITNSNTCSIASNVSGAITVNPPLAAPTASVTLQPTCIANGTITVTAPVGASYQYSINGTTYQASPVFTAVAPAFYNVTVKDIVSGCTSLATVLQVNNPPLFAAPVASVTLQPTCIANGTVTVTSFVGVNYLYSIDGGAYQSSPVFTSVAPGTHAITVKDIITGCVSAAGSVTVNNPPVLAPPVASVTLQPTCIANGTVTVTSPLGANYQYNIDGGTFQNSPVFNPVAPGTHTVTVKDIITGCISVAASVTVNNPPGLLPPPLASVTLQPTCIANGAITVTSPLGANYQYSINGGTNYQSAPLFSVSPATYNIIVKDLTTGCASAAASVTVNPPAALSAPIAIVSLQPDCNVPFGVITVTSPLGANYQYSINGTNYSIIPSFPSLVPNTYNVTVKDLATGCVSSAIVLVINPIPVLTATQVSVVLPTCLNNIGTVTVTNPLGAEFEYHIGTGAYQSSPVFLLPAGGPYIVSAHSTTTGCTSAPIPVTLLAAPTLAAPVASVTVQPTCTSGGTIEITAPLGTQYEYSIDGVTYQSGVSFTGLPPDVYSITVRDLVTGCASSAASVTVNNPPGAPAAPTVSVTQQPTCSIITGTITITAPVGATLEYSIDGTTYQSGTTFTLVAPGPYNVTVRNTATGCISAATPVTVNTLPPTPTSPIASITQLVSCASPTGTITISSPTGPNLQYSIDGINYQSSPVFTGVAPGPYNLTVKNAASGCTSSSSAITVAGPPNAPAVPIASVTQQPTCVASGVITITSPLGINLQYSINSTTFQASPVFNPVPPGSYTVYVKDITTNCMSQTSVSLTVNAVPNPPAAPTASAAKQPTCADNTGTITITAPLGTDLEYSIDGVTYQAGTTFTGLTPATYNVKVRNTTTVCISAATAVIINAIPNAPAAPTVVTAPRCGPGIITMTATGTGTLNWYSDAALTTLVFTGTTYAPSVNSGSVFYVTSTSNNCTSTAKVVNAVVNSLPVPNLGADRPVCLGENLVLSPGNFSSYLWQDNSTQPTFRVTASGTYSVKVKNAAGCENSTSVKITVEDNCEDLYFPTAFTPNGDGKNDEFGPLPPNSFTFVTAYNLVIYNRYGERVFQSNAPIKKWNGKYLGMLTPGNYVWSASYKFKGKLKTAKGNILVIR